MCCVCMFFEKDDLGSERVLIHTDGLYVIKCEQLCTMTHTHSSHTHTHSLSHIHSSLIIKT